MTTEHASPPSGLDARGRGGNVAYEVRGEGSPVVFLHALGTSRRMWDRYPLAATKWRVIAPDMRGHGGTPPAADGDYSFDALAADTIAVLDDLSIARFSVVGISVGGEIAQALAALHPDRVEKLVLVSTACVTHPARASVWGERIARAQAVGMAAVAAEAVQRWFTAAFREKHPEEVSHWQSIVARTPIEGYIGVARTLQYMDLRPLSRQIRCPTLILSGEADTAIGPNAAQEIADMIQGATRQIIPQAGHLFNLESPERFSEILQSWLIAI